MQRLWADRFARILGEELAARDFGSWHGKSPLSALGGALGLIAPWTPMVLLAIWEHFRTPRPARLAANRWLILAFLFSVLPFFFMSAFERYMLAVVPIQAVLAAQWLSSDGPWRGLTLRIAAVVLSVVAVVGSVVALWFRLGVWPPLMVLMVTGAVLWTAFGRVRPVRMVLLATALLTLSMGTVYPLLGLNYLPAPDGSPPETNTGHTFGGQDWPRRRSLRRQPDTRTDSGATAQTGVNDSGTGAPREI